MLPVPVTYSVPTEKTSPVFCRAFAQGCRGQVVDTLRLHQGDVALWGSPALWPLLTRARAEGRTWHYGDNGYFGRRHYFRVTTNALQHDGRGTYPSARFDAFHAVVKDWRSGGGHVVVCPNSPVFFNLHGHDVERWLGRVLAVLGDHCDRPVRVRWKVRAQRFALADDLRGAWALVTYSTNAAVEALLAGVPVFVTEPHAAAFRMGTPDLTRIESPVFPPDRREFFSALCANQWTLDEIRDGTCWRALREPREKGEGVHAAHQGV